MTPTHDAISLHAIIVASYGRQNRNLEAWRDVARDETRVYDHDYGIELGIIKDSRLRSMSRTDAVWLIQEACREPTSLEILYYAQIGGPHVRGEA